MAAAVPVHPGRHDLRRLERDPAQHHRRTHARPAPGGPSLIPQYPTGHALLDGKVAVVTASAGAGIGQAAARRCLEEGARVVISDAHARRLGETFEALKAEHGDAVTAVPCDVTDESQVQRLIDNTVEAFGRVDVMINNAGLGGTRSILEMTDDEWTHVLDVTLNGTFRCTRAALKQMVAQGDGGA